VNFFRAKTSFIFILGTLSALSQIQTNATPVVKTTDSPVIGFSLQNGTGDYWPDLVFFTESASCENNSQTAGKLINPAAYYGPSAPENLSSSATYSSADLYNFSHHLREGTLTDSSQIICVKLYDGFKNQASEAVLVSCDDKAQTCSPANGSTPVIFDIYSNTASRSS